VNNISRVLDILAGIGRLMSEEQTAEPDNLGREPGTAAEKTPANAGDDSFDSNTEGEQ
jgi:hypothetical protein